MKTIQKWFFAVMLTQTAVANLAPDKKMHHYFNATLLAPKEQQIGITSTYRRGITDDLELGTLGLAWLGKTPNLSLKHRMFVTDRTTVAMSGHFFLPLKVELADRDFYGHMEMFGIVTSTALSPTIDLNINLFDFSASLATHSGKEYIDASVIFPVIGLDWVLGKRVGISILAFIPTMMSLDVGDNGGEISLSYLLLDPYTFKIRDTNLYFASTTLSFGVFNLEIGLSGKTTASPYLNLFWRFG